MELYGHKSIPQKLVLHCLEILMLWVSYWILFQGGGPWVEEHLGISNAVNNTERNILIFSFNIVVFLRMAYMMVFLLKRKIPWEESVSVPMAFALYFIGFPLFGLSTTQPLDGWDFLAIAVFVIGSVLNTAGEIFRNRWKMDPRNRGKLYTGGFFRYSRHINYFGDLLWVSAYSLITRNIWSVSIPVLLFCFFAFYNAPKLDRYLKEKYGKDYESYAKKTKMLIPFVY